MVQQHHIPYRSLMQHELDICACQLEPVVEQDLFQQVMDRIVFFLQGYLVHGSDLKYLADKDLQSLCCLCTTSVNGFNFLYWR